MVAAFDTAVQLIGKCFTFLTDNAFTSVIVAISLILVIVGVIISKVKG